MVIYSDNLPPTALLIMERLDALNNSSCDTIKREIADFG
jgi:hypothetical protein